MSLKERAQYMRDYRARYPEKFRVIAAEQSRKWRRENPERSRIMARQHRRKWRALNPLKYKEQQRMCLLNNPHTALANRIRGRVNRVLRGQRKYDRTFNLVGCSPAQLKTHLESQFDPGMNWVQRSAWHVDHITPISFYDLTRPEEQAQAFHWSNLQPLWREANLSKGSKLVYQRSR